MEAIQRDEPQFFCSKKKVTLSRLLSYYIDSQDSWGLILLVVKYS